MKVYTITVNKNRVSNFLAEAGQAYTGPNRWRRWASSLDTFWT
jgi:hypothetical protein